MGWTSAAVALIVPWLFLGSVIALGVAAGTYCAIRAKARGK